MNKNFFKGFILAFILLGIIGTLTAVGFHSANEILSGTFSGNYFFEGKVDLNNEIILANYSVKPICQLSNKGSLIYDDVNSKPFVCNGTNWKPLDSDFDSDGITDWLDVDDTNASLLLVNLTSENIKSEVLIGGIEGNLTKSFEKCSYNGIDGMKLKSICLLYDDRKFLGHITSNEAKTQGEIFCSSKGGNWRLPIWNGIDIIEISHYMFVYRYNEDIGTNLTYKTQIITQTSITSGGFAGNTYSGALSNAAYYNDDYSPDLNYYAYCVHDLT